MIPALDAMTGRARRTERQNVVDAKQTDPCSDSYQPYACTWFHKALPSAHSRGEGISHGGRELDSGHGEVGTPARSDHPPLDRADWVGGRGRSRCGAGDVLVDRSGRNTGAAAF